MSVRVGVIGAGNIGQDHARRLSQRLSGASVASVSDVDSARADAVASAVGARVRTTGHELIRDSAVDAVVVATWGPSHEEFVLAAIEHDKPVFCEKPLAPTTDACVRILEAEVARGHRLVQIGFMRRYDGGYRAMKDVVRSGQVGTPLLVHNAHRGPTALPTFTSDMLITDSGIHEIDLMRWLLEEEVVATTALRPRRSTRAQPGVQTPLMILLETESGVLADVEVFVNVEYGYDIRCELVGEVGTVSLGDASPVIVRHAGQRAGRVPQDWIERFQAAYDSEVQAWIDSVAAGQATGPSVWDGYAATAVASACVASLGSGERTAVHLPSRPSFYHPTSSSSANGPDPGAPGSR